MSSSPATHGATSRSNARRSGFLALPDHSRLLKGVAPDGYYKNSFQTPEFTLRTFSDQFEVLEYVEAALGYQDLVAMRRPT